MLVMIAVIYIIIILVYDHICGVSADHNSKTYIKDIPTPTKPTNKLSRSSLEITLEPLKQRHTLIHTSAHTRTLNNETEGLLSVVPPSQ